MPEKLPEGSFQRIDPRWRLNQVGERTAIAARMAVTFDEMTGNLLAQLAAFQPPHQTRLAPPALLARETEIAEAGLTGSRRCRPYARMEARKDSHAHFRRKLNGLTACNRNKLRFGDGIGVMQ
jgi:hypothetical protein